PSSSIRLLLSSAIFVCFHAFGSCRRTRFPGSVQVVKTASDCPVCVGDALAAPRVGVAVERTTRVLGIVGVPTGGLATRVTVAVVTGEETAVVVAVAAAVAVLVATTLVAKPALGVGDVTATDVPFTVVGVGVGCGPGRVAMMTMMAMMATTTA